MLRCLLLLFYKVDIMPNYDGLTATFINLLNADYDNPGFSVLGPVDGKYTLKTTAEAAPALLKELHQAFQSHGHTLERMPYQIKALSDPKTQAVEVEFPRIDFPLVDIERLSGKEIFERLFSPEIRENNGNIVHWTASKGTNQQTVYSYIGEAGETDIRTLQVNLFRQILSHASRADLYQAFAEGSFKSLPVPEPKVLYSKNMTGTGPLAPHLKNDSLLTIRDNQGKPVVLFDALGLAKCLLAPKFTLEAFNPAAATCSSSDGYNTEITFNESDFLSYMSTLLNHGIFMHVKDDLLYPVAYPHAQAIQSLTLIDFVIDCSGSMAGEPIERLKTHLTNIIERLYTEMDPMATFIRFSPFNTTLLPPVEFPLTQKSKLIEEIKKLFATGGTQLYEAIVKSAEYALTKTNMNKVSIYMTDGQDTSCMGDIYNPNNYSSNLFRNTLNDLKNDRNKPKFFSIEIGDLTDAILQQIQQITTGERIQANSDLSNFDIIYNYVHQFGLSRRYIDFYQKACSFRLEVLQGKISISQKSLDPTEAFSINDQAMVAQKPDVSSLFTISKATSNTAADDKEQQEKIQLLVVELQHQQKLEIDRLKEESAKQHQLEIQQIKAEANQQQELQLAALKTAHETEQKRHAQHEAEQKTAMEALKVQNTELKEQMAALQAQMQAVLLATASSNTSQMKPLQTAHTVASEPSTLEQGELSGLGSATEFSTSSATMLSGYAAQRSRSPSLSRDPQNRPSYSTTPVNEEASPAQKQQQKESSCRLM